MKKYRVKINGKVFDVELESIEEVESKKETSVVKKEEKVVSKNDSESLKILAPIQGSVLDILVKKGDKVKKGDILLLIEAMKLENEVNAICDCEIKDVLVKKGDSVKTNEVLITYSR